MPVLFYKQFENLAKSLGFILDVSPKPMSPHNVFRLQHKETGVSLTLDEFDGRNLLQFLSLCHWSDKASRSEERLAGVETQLQELTSALLTAGLISNKQNECSVPNDLLDFEPGTPEFYVRLQEMAASTGGTAEFGVKTDVTSRYFVRYHRLPALKIETMVAKALPKRVTRTYAFYFELPRDLELLQQVLKNDAKLYLELLHSNNSYAY